MKMFIMVTICLLTFTAPAQEAESFDYTSLMNFDMPAFEVVNSETDTINIIIKEAALRYPDRGFDSNKVDELKEVFNMEELNSVILTYPKESCDVRNNHDIPEGQIISCRHDMAGENRRVEIRGASTEFSGKVSAVSKLKLAALVSVNFVHNRTMSTSGEVSSFQAIVFGNIPPQDHVSTLVRLSLRKSHIVPRKF